MIEGATSAIVPPDAQRVARPHMDDDLDEDRPAGLGAAGGDERINLQAVASLPVETRPKSMSIDSWSDNLSVIMTTQVLILSRMMNRQLQRKPASHRVPRRLSHNWSLLRRYNYVGVDR
jgi:hypothetical protein